ncbi:MAG: hypothetical protein M3552_00450 [Planctomycetota bacterium]|nr:hypothetical protein [Planctomycetaceae bacterium]MDQ3329115.1 hypothetical protein [Planctomycetota bacterium]
MIEHILALLIHALPIACIAWTVTHEEIFREFNEYCSHRSENCRRLLQRKFFYLFTCEFCFSFWVTAALLLVTGFKVYYADWRGYLLAFFSLPWLANAYMNIYHRLRVDIRKSKAEADQEEASAERVNK